MTSSRRWLALGGAVGIVALIIVVIQATVAPPPPPAPSLAASDAPAVVAAAASTSERLGPPAPDFVGITRWLNSDPLTLEDLEGRVVLVDFWTYTCINCLRTLPYLRDWQEKYAGKGLTIVGVHSPEFEFEKIEANVREAVVRERVTWPVAQDNDFATWRAYANRYWPHKFLIDKDGAVRYDHVGEGAYGETELQIRALLEEAGYDISGIAIGGVDVETRLQQRITRELYAGIGWFRGGYLGNPPSVLLDGPIIYDDPGGHEDGRFYLHGEWENDSESVRHTRATEDFQDYVGLRYKAASVNAVTRPQGAVPFRVIVTLDGGPVPERLYGDDLRVDDDGRTFVEMGAPKLYNVIRSEGVEDHDLRLHVNSMDFVLYTFTFGS